MDHLIDLAEAHQSLGLKPAQIRKLILRGDIEGIQPGGQKGKWFVRQTELDRLTRRKK